MAFSLVEYMWVINYTIYMKAPTITLVKKYITAIGKVKAKYVTSERLSKSMGLYPEVINENLSYFEPMLNMDSSIDLLELVPAMKQYVIDLETKKVPVERKEVVAKKEYEEYKNINDFIYRKMTIGGMFDRDYVLSEKDLKIMKHLINNAGVKKKTKRRVR
ncbi:MAG: hypothetical protein K6F59_05335 [Gammaproteobacteria bacterium]|nr:hypothetical protein [Gammaproteobacteria bacterium]